jgi:hypothetical protein
MWPLPALPWRRSWARTKKARLEVQLTQGFLYTKDGTHQSIGTPRGRNHMQRVTKELNKPSGMRWEGHSRQGHSRPKGRRWKKTRQQEPVHWVGRWGSFCGQRQAI